MESKKLIWLGMFLGSFIGSYLPELWGAGMFSASSLVLGAVGGIIGIWLGFRISR
jgi:hypothetical protein